MNGNKIRIMTVNANSIRTHHRRMQLQLLVHDLNPDIVLVQETNLCEFHKPIISGYRIHTDQRGVGTAVLIKNRYKSYQKHIDTSVMNACMVVIERRRPNEDLLIGSLYIPCGTSGKNLKDDFKILEQVNRLGMTCILGGDLNSRHTDWDTKSNTTGVALKRWLDKGDSELLRVSPPAPTFRDSKLDHFLVSQSEFNLANTRVFVKDTFADHRTAVMDCWPDRPLNMELKSINKIRDYKRTNWLEFRKKIEEHILANPIPEDKCLSNEEIDDQIIKISEMITRVQNSEIPTFTQHKNHYKDVPKETIVLIKHQRTIKKALNRERAKIAPSLNKIQDLKLTLARIRLKIKTNTMAQMKSAFENKIMKIRPGPHFFTQVNLLAGRKRCEQVTKIMKNDTPVYNPDEIKKEFTEYYKQLYTETRPQEVETVSFTNSKVIFDTNNKATNPSAEGDHLTTVEEIRLTLRGLNSKKSSGPDDICNYVIKRLPHSFVRELTVIINNCLNNGYFPKYWKTAKMIPIKKKNEATKPQEFRPVSLLSNLGKVLESVILRQLKVEMEEKETIPPHQFGFRKGHSTMDALKVFRDEVTKDMNNRRATVACLIDFEKAFDSVFIDGLIHKLKKAEINEHTIKILQSFLKERKADVMIDGANTEEFNVQRGVPQGSKLGPVLYNIYISDMPSMEEMDCKIIQYADDTILYAASQSPKLATKKLQKAIDKTSSFFDEWGIKINENKTEVVVLTPDKKNRIPSCMKLAKEVKISIKNKDIKPVKEVKYLGVVIAERLHFDKHVDETIKKARGAFFQLMPILKKLEINQKHRTHLYKQLIRPILTYGFPIWATVTKSRYENLAMLERKIIRAITNKYRHEDERGIRYYSDAKLREETGIIDIRHHLRKTCSNFKRRMKTHENQRIREQNAWKSKKNSRFILTKDIRTSKLAGATKEESICNRG